MIYPNLETELRHAGISQKEMSKKIEMPYSTLFQKLSGKRKTRLRDALKIRDTLFPGMKIDYLFDMEASSPDNVQQ